MEKLAVLLSIKVDAMLEPSVSIVKIHCNSSALIYTERENIESIHTIYQSLIS